MSKVFYIYGSENSTDNGKIHIADDNGKVLCGANILFGEITAIITSMNLDEDEIFTVGFGRDKKDVPTQMHIWSECKCSKCDKKLKLINNEKS